MNETPSTPTPKPEPGTTILRSYDKTGKIVKEQVVPPTPAPAAVAPSPQLQLLQQIAESTTITAQLLNEVLQVLQASANVANSLLQLMQRPAPQPASQPAATQQLPEGTYKDFTAEAVLLGYSDKGDPTYKLIGFPYTKYGVRVWPEVLPLLGIVADQLKPGPNPLNPPVNVRALLVDNESGTLSPKKVIGLATGPVHSQQPPEEDMPF